MKCHTDSYNEPNAIKPATCGPALSEEVPFLERHNGKWNSMSKDCLLTQFRFLHAKFFNNLGAGLMKQLH